MKKTNKQRVLEYMKDFGSISSIEAFKDLGNTRLSASIFELKKDGYNIKSKTECGVNRYGEKTHYSRYSLVEDEIENHIPFII